MKKYLRIRFKLEQIIIALSEQTLLLGFGALLSCKIWEFIFSLNSHPFISAWLPEIPHCFSILLFAAVLLVLLFLLYIDEIFTNAYRMTEFFSPMKERGYPLSYQFNWSGIIFYVLCMGFMAYVYSWWLVLGYIALVNIVSLLVLFGKGRDLTKKFGIPNQPSDNLLKDMPIVTLGPGFLGRSGFVKTFYNIIFNSKGSRNILLLNGAWGVGKTSVLNCVEHYAKSQNENNLIFKWINPWQNDTKERFVNALLEEINLFLEYTYPKDIMSRSLLRHLSVSVSPYPFIQVDFSSPKESANIGVNIRELSAKLSPKQNRLVIIVDDLDRLDKRQILDILAIVYLFSECPNIVFVLAANQAKVESLLTEEQGCHEDDKIHHFCKAYQGYLEKIATNIVPLPDIGPEVLRDSLLQNIEALHLKKEYSLSQEEKDAIPISLFHNFRDVKRVLQAFFNVMQQPTIQEEVSPYHMLLVTFLYVFAPKIYTEIGKTPSYWIQESIKNKTLHMEENYDELKSYFDRLLGFYPDRKNEIETVFLILNPEYLSIQHWKQMQQKNSSGIEWKEINARFLSSHLRRPFYNKDYFERYFTHQIGANIISDKIMSKHINEISSLPQKEGVLKVMRFLNVKSIMQVLSYFNYLRNNLPFNDFKRQYETISIGMVLLFNSNTVDVDKKMKLMEEILSQWAQQGESLSEQIKYIFDNVNSIFIKIRILYTVKAHNIELYKQLSLPSPGKYTALDILQEEERYSGMFFAEYLLFFWLRGWRDHVPYNKARKNQTVGLFKRNEHYFWLVIGNSLYEVIDSDAFFKRAGELSDTWGLSTLKSIIASLLKNPNLAHRDELFRLGQSLASPDITNYSHDIN